MIDQESSVRSPEHLASAVLLLCSLAAAQSRPGDSAPAASRPSSRQQTISLQHGGTTRTCLVHAPPARADGPARPLVLVLHGRGGSAVAAMRNFGWNAVADREGFVVAYPEGTGTPREWNAVNCCGQALRAQVDDVGCIEALLAEIRARHAIDEKRIFVTGMSNGAMMAHRLGGELAATFAAIAPVAGTAGGRLAGKELLPKAPERPISVLMVHGTKDNAVPYEGSPPGRADFSFVSAARSVEVWVGLLGCEKEGTREEIVPKRVLRETHGGGKDGAEVVLYTVVDGGHAWPRGELATTEVVWEFFKRHAR
jgi:polyhydroxybutyrate depolymerase